MSAPDGFKTVYYRGELVVFELPAHWIEEQQPDGGGTFYDPADESLTLRLNVMTLQSPRDLVATDAEAVLQAAGLLGSGVAEPLPNGQVLSVLPPTQARESGQLLVLHTWAVGRVVPPRCVRIAVFTTTITADGREASGHSDLPMLLARVRECRIAAAPPTPLPASIR